MFFTVTIVRRGRLLNAISWEPLMWGVALRFALTMRKRITRMPHTSVHMGSDAPRSCFEASLPAQIIAKKLSTWDSPSPSFKRSSPSRSCHL